MWLSLAWRALRGAGGFLVSTPGLLLLAALSGAAGGSWATYRLVKAGEVRALNGALEERGALIAQYEQRLQAREAERADAQRAAASWQWRWKHAQDNPETERWSTDPLVPDARERVRQSILDAGGQVSGR